MKIHEYQGKEIFRKFGVPTPRGIPAFSVDEAAKAVMQFSEHGRAQIKRCLGLGIKPS